MTRLLDYIFRNLEEKNLDKQQIIDYVRYLDELILGGLPMETELHYQAIKLKLLSRMNVLNHEQLKFHSKDKEDKQ